MDLRRLSSGTSRVLTNSALSWMRIIGVAAAKLITTRFLLSALGLESFGIFFSVASIALLSTFLTGAIQATSLRAISLEAPRGTDISEVFNGLLGLHILSASVMLVFGTIVGLWLINYVMIIPAVLLGSARYAFLCIISATILGNFFAAYEAFLQAKERFGVFAFIEMLSAWLLLPISIWLGQLDGDRIKVYATLVALLTIIGPLAGTLLTIRDYPATRPKPRLFFNRTFLREHGWIASWSLIGSAASVARTQGLTLLVNIIGGPTANAALAIANQIPGALRQFSDTIRVVLAPRIYGKEAHGERQQMLCHVFAACKISTLVTLIAAIPLMTELPMVLELWLGKSEREITYVCMLLLINLIVDQTSAGTGIAHMALGQVARFQLIAGGLSLLMLPIGYLLAQFSGRYIDLLFVLIAFTFLIVVTRVVLLWPQIANPVSMWGSETVWATAKAALPPSLLSLALVDLLPPSVSRLILTLALVTIASVASAYVFGLSQMERDKLCGVFQRKSLKA